MEIRVGNSLDFQPLASLLASVRLGRSAGLHACFKGLLFFIEREGADPGATFAKLAATPHYVRGRGERA